MYIDDWAIWWLFMIVTYPIVITFFKKIEAYCTKKEKECDEVLEGITNLKKYFKDHPEKFKDF